LKAKGPAFVKWFNPLLTALKQLGGSGSASEVIATIAENENVPESVQQEKLKSGGLRFNNQIHFARQYLLWAGLLSSSQRGVWTLTEKGASTSLTHEEALKIFRQQHSLHQKKKESSDNHRIIDNDEEIPGEPETSYKERLLEKLKALTPSAFEHFSKRLLREYGFEKLEVTGGPKDKGIDGTGILKINPFVSFRVAFQCKRYDQAVVSSAISTFRGSIPSSVDKGIMITTGYFTSDAKSLAQNPGLKPIELIDGDQLIELLEKMELGLKPTFIVDEDFFDGF
jgi:restriction system protein